MRTGCQNVVGVGWIALKNVLKFWMNDKIPKKWQYFTEEEEKKGLKFDLLCVVLFQYLSCDLATTIAAALGC